MNETNVLEIEIDTARNGSLHFRPMERRIRGRLDLNRVAEPTAKMKTNEFPLPIPGQRIRLDMNNRRAELIEPLRHEEHLVTRERIEKKGYRIAPESEAFEDVDLPTWLYWMKRAVTSGYARLVAGVLPDKIAGEPRKEFFFKKEPGTQDRLADAIDSLAAATSAQTKLLAELVKSLKQN